MEKFCYAVSQIRYTGAQTGQTDALCSETKAEGESNETSIFGGFEISSSCTAADMK